MTSITETNQSMDARAEFMLGENTKLPNFIYTADITSSLESKMYTWIKPLKEASKFERSTRLNNSDCY